jgi:hypothetical protein
MRSKLIVLLLAYAITLLPMQFAAAQQPQADAVEQLKEQIKRLEAVDRDASISEEVRLLNHKFLDSRRQQLWDLVDKRIADLRAYQTKMESTISADEKALIETSIQQLQASVRGLDSLPPPADKAVNHPADVSSETEENNGSPTRQSGSAISDVSAAGNSGTALATTNSSPRVVAPVKTPPAACAGSYTNPPPRLDQMAQAIALLIVDQVAEDRAKTGAANERNISGQFEKHYTEAVFLTVADALFTDAQKVSLRKLTWQQFSAETRRTDKQIGATARSGGSTSLFEKPNFSDLLSFAIDHGAIQKEVDKTSLTLSTSPYAVIASIHGDTSDVYRQYDFFNRIGISANFNLDNQDNVLANASRKQLNQWSLKFRLNPDRTARGQTFNDFWDNNIKQLIGKRAIVLTTGFNDLFNDVRPLEKLRRSVRDNFEGNTGYLMTVVENTKAAAADAQAAALKQEILCRLRDEVYDPLDKGNVSVPPAAVASLNKSIVDFADAQLEAGKARDDVRAKLKELDDKPIGSISYTNVRPSTGSYYSVFKGMYLQKAFDPMKVSIDGELSVYHNPDPKLNQQRLRDALFTVALDGKLGRSPFVTTTMDESQITFSFSGSYQRLLENTKGTNKKADLVAGQAKLEIPVFTGFSLPLAVTYSNATEEQKKRHFRFNFGFGLDTDKLIALMLAKKALNK